MKQLIQNLKTGETSIEEVAVPALKPNNVLIQATYSLVSLGTERMLVDFGKAGYIAKARQQPERVKEVLNKVKTEGLLPTMEAVFNKLDQPLPLGYCHVGKVVEVGEGVNDLRIGDRVISNGNHAEFVCVPKNLVAKIPDNVSDEEASFTVIGSIGLQGIRLLEPNLGETVVVIGLGLIGLITAELLLSSGCRVIGFDVDESKVAIANSKGVEAFNVSKEVNSVTKVQELTQNIGADGVIITASSKGNELIEQAAKMSRKRGKIVLVGVTGLNINRADFYEKELSFQVSCSYGPGRYDDNYEQKGIDYPLPFVRWTEKRNFETILFTIAHGRLDVKSLITEIVPFTDYNQIYGEMTGSEKVASILKYDANPALLRTVTHTKRTSKNVGNGTAIIGAGNFTKMTLLPSIKGLDSSLLYISSANGLNAASMAKRYAIQKSTSNNEEIFEDKDVKTVVITTRHNSHASLVVRALQADKNVFVEKPLALNEKELEHIKEAYQSSKGLLTVGFNRRFSPHSKKIKKLTNGSPMNVITTMNAGSIPPKVWVHDMKIGGGRIIGEACHFIDLITYFVGSKVSAVCMNALGNSPTENTDNASILLKYENGSTGVVNYFSNGSKAYAKERVEVFSEGKILVLDNFRRLEGFGFGNFKSLKTKLDKGHKEQFRLIFEKEQQQKESIIPFDELINTSEASFAAIKSLKQKTWVTI